ncbi:protocadherin Fat 3-like isoform X2 [Paramacrobiotus metropolitanus]|nr:protocadherin Fat 3-like isoform X2 [Paramacrobiotus metropolitanus]
MVQNGSSIFLTIPESFSPGKSFKTLDMIEGDASAKGNINLRLKEPNRYFGLDSQSKSLILLREIDRETLEAKNPPETVQKLTLVCEYLDGDSWRRIDVPVQIVVTDVNDNAPHFRNTPYAATVSELAPVGSVILKDIHANDADSTGNMVIYSIVKGPYSDYVRLEDTLSGTLILNHQLDFENEQHKVFNITIMAKDQGNPPLTATANVQITVEDGDDLNPEFQQPRYTAALPRDARIGYELKVQPETIKALDRDHGMLTPVVYSIVEGGRVFDIDKKTGVVTVNGTIDQTLYVLTIKATQVDNPGRYTLTTLRISAETPNRKPPKFAHKEYHQKVLENTPVNTTILSVQATDDDVGAVLVYSLLASEAVPHFALTASGNLYITMPLDYENATGYILFARVTDGEFTDQTKIVIEVLNENDHDPQFSETEYIFDIPVEKKYRGSPMGHIRYWDRDGDHVFTTLAFLDEHMKGVFTINGSEITLMADADEVNRTEYRFFVVAEDSGDPPRKSSVPVTINFPAVALPATAPIADQYFVLAIVLGSLAGLLLLIVLCLVCYVGKTKPWSRKSPAGTLRSCPLDDDTRGLTYKQRVPYHDIVPVSSSSASSDSETSSHDLHPVDNPGLQTDDLSPKSSPISAWGSSSAVAASGPVHQIVSNDLGLSPKGIILSTGNTPRHNNNNNIGVVRKQKRLKWEDEEKPGKSMASVDHFEFGWQSSETLSPMQTDTERPEVTVYF